MAVALVASVSMSAQYAHVNYGTTEVDQYVEAAATPGYVVCTTNGGNVTTVFADTWKVVNVKTDGYGFFLADGNALNTDTLGLQGQSNGKDADGNNPATSLQPYKSGAAYGFTATATGYLTVFHKGSSNKQYVVFEEGSAIAYEYAQLATINEAPEAIYYALEGDGDGYVTDPIMKVEEIVVKEGFASKNGESAMRFPVYEGLEYLFGATGSKLSLLGVYFSEDKAEISVSKANGAEPIVLLPGGLTAIENNAEAVKATKAIENGQMIIIKNGVRYNTVGARL